jgi:hypothetical protein
VNDDDARRLESLGLPETLDLASVNEAEIAVIRLASERRISGREALYYSRMLEHRRRAIGDVTLEQMMKELERQGREQRGEEP